MGQAPKDPWLRKTTSGSRLQKRGKLVIGRVYMPRTRRPSCTHTLLASSPEVAYRAASRGGPTHAGSLTRDDAHPGAERGRTRPDVTATRFSAAHRNPRVPVARGAHLDGGPRPHPGGEENG